MKKIKKNPVVAPQDLQKIINIIVVFMLNINQDWKIPSNDLAFHNLKKLKFYDLKKKYLSVVDIFISTNSNYKKTMSRINLSIY